VAEDLELALVGDGLRGQELHRRRLARAVGPEQADAAAVGDVEVQAVDGGDVAEALDDAAQPDGRRGGDRGGGGGHLRNVARGDAWSAKL
jgi:hypothetical protein